MYVFKPVNNVWLKRLENALRLARIEEKLRMETISLFQHFLGPNRILFHFFIEQAAVNAQFLRGVLDVPAVLTQKLFDYGGLIVLHHLFEWLALLVLKYLSGGHFSR